MVVSVGVIVAVGVKVAVDVFIGSVVAVTVDEGRIVAVGSMVNCPLQADRNIAINPNVIENFEHILLIDTLLIIRKDLPLAYNNIIVKVRSLSCSRRTLGRREGMFFAEASLNKR
jgi:hypothetical protein